MKNINIKKLKKFWGLLSNHKRSVPTDGGIYQGRCEKEVFVSRVSRMLLSAETPMKILFEEEERYDYILPRPVHTVTRENFKTGKKEKYLQYSLQFFLSMGHDEITFVFLDHKGNYSSKRIDHNSSMAIMYQKITMGHYYGIVKKFSIPIKVKFNREYSLIKIGVKGSDVRKKIDAVKIVDKQSLLDIKEILDNKYNFIKPKKEGLIQKFRRWQVNINDMSEEELKKILKAPKGELYYSEAVYNLVDKLLNIVK